MQPKSRPGKIGKMLCTDSSNPYRVCIHVQCREGGKQKLLAANVGDARVLLARKGKAVQLTTDHVPDRSGQAPF